MVFPPWLLTALKYVFGIRIHEPPQQYWKFLRWALAQADQGKRDETQAL